MVAKTIKGKVKYVGSDDVEIEFGQTQANMDFSANGGIQRLLKLKEDDRVEVTIKKV